MSDPFDPSGLGSGTDPNVWQNLMNFGAATAANATPAPTTLGAIGKGILGAGEAARANVQSNSQRQYVGAETGAKNLSNSMQLMAINAWRKHANLPPLQLDNYGKVMPMQSVQAPSNPATVPSSMADSSSSPQESSGMAGPVWSPTPGTTRLNSQPQTNAYPVAQPTAQSGSIDPFDAPAGVDQAKFDQANYLNFMGNPLGKNVGELAFAGPTAEAEAIAKARHPGIIEARQGGIAYAPEAGITATGRLEGETTGGAKYLTPPNISGPNLSIGGEPTQVQGQPQQAPMGGQTSAPTVDQMTAAMPGGAAGIAINAPNPNGPMQSQTAAGGYSGVPSGAVLTDIGPGAKVQIEDLAKFHADGEHGELKSYNAAMGSQQNLTQLQSYLDTINAHQGDPNFLASGVGSETRLELAKMANTAWSVAGGDPKTPPISDPTTVAAGEAAYKTANLLGMQLINSQFGASREAASIVMTGLKSVPSMENTPQGAQLLVNGAKEISNNTIDRYTFKDWWAREDGPHPGDLRGADAAFNKMFPPQLYAKRAISQEQPIDITGLKNAPNLLPGTIIKYGSAPPKVLPVIQKYDFELPSINGGQ